MLKDFLEKDENDTVSKEISKEKQPEIKKDDKEYDTREFQALAEYMKREHELEITPDSHIEIDLGLDSLDVVEMNAFIEKTFGFTVNEEEAGGIKVIRDICGYIREHSHSYTNESVNWKDILNEKIDYQLPKSSVVLLFRYLTAPVFKFYLKLTKKGVEKISSEPRIYVINHESFADAFAVGHMFTKQQAVNTYYFAIKKHFEKPVMKYLADHGNIVLVDINKNLKESLQIAAEVLKEGKNLVIFPEGARTRDGEIHEFKKFFAILSKELNIPVTVIGIDGFYKAMPFGSSFPKAGKVTAEVIGDVYPEENNIDEIVFKCKNMISEWKKKI